MRRENRDVARHELIGLEVAVKSPHAGWNGLSGRVVDETKNAFLVEAADGRGLLVPKKGQEFVFTVMERRVVGTGRGPRDGESRFVGIRGDEIQHRPEDRTKKIRS